MLEVAEVFLGQEEGEEEERVLRVGQEDAQALKKCGENDGKMINLSPLFFLIKANLSVRVVHKLFLDLDADF